MRIVMLFIILISQNQVLFAQQENEGILLNKFFSDAGNYKAIVQIKEKNHILVFELGVCNLNSYYVWIDQSDFLIERMAKQSIKLKIDNKFVKPNVSTRRVPNSKYPSDFYKVAPQVCKTFKYDMTRIYSGLIEANKVELFFNPLFAVYITITGKSDLYTNGLVNTHEKQIYFRKK